jgi:hypothetical protein
LDYQEVRQQKRNKRRRLQKEQPLSNDQHIQHDNPSPHPEEDIFETSSIASTDKLPSPLFTASSSVKPATSLAPRSSSSHISSHDAYMTGCVFASLLSRLGEEKVMEEAHHRIYLMGQQMPLFLCQSAYVHLSSCVKELIQQRTTS